MAGPPSAIPRWLVDFAGTEALDEPAISALAGLKLQAIPARTVLFEPGNRPQGFLLVIEGRVGVYLLGRSGREMLLYTVTPGETCVQTTLGLLGDEAYSAEALAETPLSAVMVPVPVFQRLMATSAPFRTFVFRAFASRVGDLMFVLEQVAFVRIESRLAGAILERADAKGVVAATHQELAVAIGSVREVVTRQLHGLASRGFVTLDRGLVHVVDRGAIVQISQQSP